jgi:hypothetical protein
MPKQYTLTLTAVVTFATLNETGELLARRVAALYLPEAVTEHKVTLATQTFTGRTLGAASDACWAYRNGPLRAEVESAAAQQGIDLAATGWYSLWVDVAQGSPVTK